MAPDGNRAGRFSEFTRSENTKRQISSVVMTPLVRPFAGMCGFECLMMFLCQLAIAVCINEQGQRELSRPAAAISPRKASWAVRPNFQMEGQPLSGRLFLRVRLNRNPDAGVHATSTLAMINTAWFEGRACGCPISFLRVRKAQ